MTSSIRMVCFDIGGVLVKHRRTWEEGCAAAGLPVRAGSVGPEKAAHRRELASAYTCGRIDDEHFCREMSRLMGEYSPEDVRKIHHCWLGPEYDGVAAVIHRLTSINTIDTGVLSNTNQAHWGRMLKVNGKAAEFPTPTMLRHRHASHLLGMAKPDPRVFREFERRTDYRGAEILYFEDLPENAEVAKSQGWIVELIDHTGDTAAQLEAALARHGIFE
jgi:FMN phosphatase YigB (HAD superfamily)